MRIESLQRLPAQLRALAGKYRIPLLVCLLGLLLLLWPQRTAETKQVQSEPAGFSLEAVQQELTALLAQVEGAGQVRVMLTLSDSAASVYQVDETSRDSGTEQKTVFADKSPVLVRTRYPRYQGAVIVCEGAGSPAVRLAIKEAVASLTGLGSDKITVIKMKGQ